MAVFLRTCFDHLCSSRNFCCFDHGSNWNFHQDILDDFKHFVIISNGCLCCQRKRLGKVRQFNADRFSKIFCQEKFINSRKSFLHKPVTNNSSTVKDRKRLQSDFLEVLLKTKYCEAPVERADVVSLGWWTCISSWIISWKDSDGNLGVTQNLPRKCH